MFRNSVLTFAAALMAVVALAGVAAELNAAVLVSVYSEDFEGGTDPQSILAAPFSYANVNGGAGNPQVKSGSLLPTRAVDGSTASGLCAATKAIAGPDAGTLAYRLRADLYAPSGNNDSGIGLSSNTIAGAFNDSGAYLVLDANSWKFDASGVGGAIHDFTAGVGLDEPVVGTIYLNLTAKTVTGSIAHSGGTMSHTYNLPAALTNVMGIDKFAIQEDGRVGMPARVDVDNVQISQFVPAPPAGLVMYSEDFEGGTDPQSILAEPFFYSAAFGSGNPQVQSGSFLPTRAVDGSTASGLNAATYPIVGPDASMVSYTLSADLYAPSGPNDSGIGLSANTIAGAFNNTGAYLRADGNGWELDASGVVGSPAIVDFDAGVGLDEPVVGTIRLDLLAKTVTGSIAHSGGTMSRTFNLPADLTNVMAIDKFAIQEDRRGGFPAWVDVDNVRITRVVPEPASGVLALLGLVGLLVGGRRRRPDH